ncbi:MAG: hypothetical protein ACI4SL_08330 [Candidatus Ornithospirochaeta sp.]
MKRLSIVMLALLFVMASLMVSCDNNSNQIKDEVVEVRFGTKEEGRGLSASVPLESVDDPSLTWYYKATKKSQLDFVTGAAEKKELTLGEPITFSQGKWDFELLAEKDGKEVYWGKVDGVLITKADSPKTIVISVSPSIAGVNGAVQFNNVKIQKHSENSTTIETTAANTITLDGEAVTLVDGSAIIEDVEPGSHEVFVAYLADVDGNQIVYASETIFITVYSGRTTVISGNVSEEVGSADIGVVATSTQVTETVTVGTEKTFIAGVAPSNATAPTGNNNNTTTVTFPAGAITSASEEETSVSAVLSVDTQSIENNITIIDGSTAVAGINVNLTVDGAPVTTFNGEYVTITTFIAKGLSNVKVVYNGDGDQPIASDVENTNVAAVLSTDEGTALGYNSGSGLLRFKTTHFSQFDVSADAICYSPNTNTGYSTIQAAINDAPKYAGDAVFTISLLKDVEAGQAFGFPDKMAAFGKNILIDLNEKTYTFKDPGMGSSGTESQAMHLIYGNKLTLQNGTIRVSESTTTIKRMIQNYCDLTLVDVIVDCSKVVSSYNNSICRGSLTVKGNTDFIAASDSAKIFDVDGAYCDTNGCDVEVVFDETYTGTTSGVIEYVSSNGHTSKLTIKAGTFTGEITASGSGKPSISGGTFSYDPSDYIADGFGLYKEGSHWKVVRDISSQLEATDENIVINLDSDVTFNKSDFYKKFGGANTQSITINGNGHKVIIHSTYRNHIVTENPSTKLILNNLTFTSDYKVEGSTWDDYAIIFDCDTEMDRVKFERQVALIKAHKHILDNVTINQTSNTGDMYALWIEAGANVSISNSIINSINPSGSSNRAIKIADEYITDPQLTTLSVSGTTFKSQKKAAVLVTSTAGANITWGTGNDISGVAADSINAVWNDSDRTAAWDLVTVTGCTKGQE